MSRHGGPRASNQVRDKKAQKAEVARLFGRAVELHNTGLLPDAQAVLGQLLRLVPRHFDALYLLGMSEYYARSYHEAEQHLGRAAEVEPRSAKAHLNRGVALFALGRFEEAGASYRRAIALDPQYAVALNNLGNVCLMLGRLDEALAQYDKALAVGKDFHTPWYCRGLVLHQLGRHEEALHSFDQALTFDPRHAEALNGRASVYRTLGRPAEALESYDRAVAINPNLAEAFNNRGNILREFGRFAEARDSFDRAIAINPNFAEAHNGRGGVSTNMRDFEQAFISLQRALEIRPNYPEALANRGAVWLELKRTEQALVDYDHALALAPGLAEAWVGRANALHQLSRLSEAIASCERGLSLDPGSFRAHALMGQCLGTLGQVDASIAKFDDALALKPDFEDAISLKIFGMDFKADLTFEQQRDVRRLWWERIGSKIAVPPQAPYRNLRDPDRRLVVGYVSADFRNHSAARVFKPVLQYADKAAFETVCYSCSPVEDSLTQEFQQMAGRWRDASQWTDQRLFEQIREDGVDILVDLAGHTAGNRLAVFVRKPAPIQAHGWGHCTPPGLPAIDYVFCDPVTIPPEARHLFQETIYDLPCMLTLDPLPPDVCRGELPALANGFVTFGVFNRISKITDASAEAWSQILNRLPGSRLVIKDMQLGEALARSNLLARFARCGLPADRIDLLGKTPRPEHLQAMNAIDIFLDPFPQNGGASTWESLQMGVPVVAKLGDALSSRAAGGILSAVGMRDWVADSLDGYIEIAVQHASRIEELAELRRGLPARIAASTAGNPAAYAAEVGKAYRNMWRIYCAGGTNRP
jgi:predicted O-linked N-acetylglucosamine transferase (SPINDLY family)